MISPVLGAFAMGIPLACLAEDDLVTNCRELAKLSPGYSPGTTY